MMLYVGDVGMDGCLGTEAFASPTRGALGHLLEALSAPGVELIMDVAGYSELTVWAEAARLLLVGYEGRLSIHGPFRGLDLGSADRIECQRAVAKPSEAIEIAARLEADHLVVHPFDCETLRLDGRRWEHALQSLLALCPVAETWGVTLVVENLPDPSRAADGLEQFLSLIRRLPPSARALLDVGHAHVSGWEIPIAIERLGDRLDVVHLHDNHGVHDEHLPIGLGTIPWPTVFSALGSARPACRWVTEYAGVDEPALREHLAELRTVRGRTVSRCDHAIL
jgi:sugar phosphate isomerase/epimerase